jgi:hypothetical protein
MHNIGNQMMSEKYEEGRIVDSRKIYEGKQAMEQTWNCETVQFIKVSPPTNRRHVTFIKNEFRCHLQLVRSVNFIFKNKHI